MPSVAGRPDVREAKARHGYRRGRPLVPKAASPKYPTARRRVTYRPLSTNMAHRLRSPVHREIADSAADFLNRLVLSQAAIANNLCTGASV